MKYDLNRFKTAQSNCYSQVLQEIKNGKKLSHWMWYVFPQISGLGESAKAKEYEIASTEEAQAYLMDELLSTRLLELTSILAYDIEGKSAEEIFGFPDFLKFNSSMTLFYSVVNSNKVFAGNHIYTCFEDCITKYYEGHRDTFTLEILKNKSAIQLRNRL